MSGGDGALSQELSARIANSAGKAASYLHMAEEHLQDMLDVLNAMPTVGERYERGAYRYLQNLADRVRQGRVQVIEIGEQLIAKHYRGS